MSSIKSQFLYALVLFVIIGTIIYSCKKDRIQTPQIESSSVKLTEQLKKQLLNVRDTIKQGSKSRADSVIASLDWTHLVQSSNHDTVYYTIPSSQSSAFIHDKLKAKRFIVLTFLKNNIKDVKLIDIINLSPEIAGKEQKILTDSLINKTAAFTGERVTNSLDLIFVNRQTYSNGVLTKYEYVSNKTILNSKPVIQSIQTNEKSTNQTCTDWYLVTTYYYPDGTTYSTEGYVGTTCVAKGCGREPDSVDKQGNIKIKTLCGSNSPGGTPPDPIDTTSKVVSNFCAGMDANAISAVKEAMNTFASENCITHGIYKKLYNSSRLIYCVKNDLSVNGHSVNASYDPSNATITFSSTDVISSSLDEEVFHWYQSTTYTNISQYTLNNGWVNIEFEHAVWRDIQQGHNGAQAMNRSTDAQLQAQYSQWLVDITKNYTTYPKSIADLKGQYQYFLNNFSSLFPEFGGTPINMDPNAMLGAFSLFSCN